MATKVLVPLTEEQQTKRLLFIGKCVDANIAFTNPTKFGVEQKITVQELANLNDNTLEQIYISTQKLINESTLGLKASSEPLKVSGILATDLLEFIKLTVENRNYNKWKQNQLKHKKQLEAELETMKSPSQKKRDIQNQLKELASLSE